MSGALDRHRRGMDGDASNRDQPQRAPDLISGRFDPGNGNVGEPLIEIPVIPKAFFTASDAAVAGAHRPARAAVPADGGAGIVSRGPAAPHFVQAPALPGALIVPGFDELA